MSTQKLLTPASANYGTADAATSSRQASRPEPTIPDQTADEQLNSHAHLSLGAKLLAAAHENEGASSEIAEQVAKILGEYDALYSSEHNIELSTGVVLESIADKKPPSLPVYNTIHPPGFVPKALATYQPPHKRSRTASSGQTKPDKAYVVPSLSHDHAPVPENCCLKLLYYYYRQLPLILGNTLEWYEWCVFGYMAPYIQMNFYPEDLTRQHVWRLFATPFAARLLGAFVMGYVSDHFGRKPALIVSLAGLVLFSVLQVCVPGNVEGRYCMFVLRALQGIFVAGETTSCMVHTAEGEDQSTLGSLSCLIGVSAAIGFTMANSAVLICDYFFDQDQMNAWGWRLPFFAILPLGLLFLRMRAKKLNESYGYEMSITAEFIQQTWNNFTERKKWKNLDILGRFFIRFGPSKQAKECAKLMHKQQARKNKHVGEDEMETMHSETERLCHIMQTEFGKDPMHLSTDEFNILCEEIAKNQKYGTSPLAMVDAEFGQRIPIFETPRYNIEKKTKFSDGMLVSDEKGNCHFFSKLCSYHCQCLLGLGAMAGICATWVICSVYSAMFLEKFAGLTKHESLRATMLANGVCLVIVPFIGIIQDKILGTSLTLMVATLMATICPYLVYQVLFRKPATYDDGSTVEEFTFDEQMLWMLIGCMVLGAVQAWSSAAFLFICELFPTNIRGSGVAVCVNFAMVVFGGIGPMMTARIALSQTNNGYEDDVEPISDLVGDLRLAPAVYLCFMNVISAVCVCMAALLFKFDWVLTSHIRQDKF